MIHNHHIIPKYLGGTDNSDNLVKLSVKDHAKAHKRLFWKYRRWEDKLAWLGLSGIHTHEEIVKMKMSISGKIGANITNKKYPKGTRNAWNLKGNLLITKKGNKNGYAKTYEIKCLNGIRTITNCLTEFCKERNMKFNSFHKAVIERRKQFQGYTGKLIGLTNSIAV